MLGDYIPTGKDARGHHDCCQGHAHCHDWHQEAGQLLSGGHLHSTDNEQMKFRANARRTVKFGRVDKYWHDKQPRNLCARGNSLLLEVHALLGLSLREHAPPKVHAVFGLLLHVHAPEPVAAVVASANLSHDGII